jgi:hypothetical protein
MASFRDSARCALVSPSAWYHTPDQNYTGDDSFTYTVSFGSLSGTRTVYRWASNGVRPSRKRLLRGPYQPNQYGDVILPFTILRRLDCILEPTKDEVLARSTICSPVITQTPACATLSPTSRTGSKKAKRCNSRRRTKPFRSSRQAPTSKMSS